MTLKENAKLAIRSYAGRDEPGWLQCRVLAFLETAYFDNVLNEKEHYEHDAIELVAELDGTIVGLIDVECETDPGTVCSEAGPSLAGMIWHVAVHPDHRNLGIGQALLEEAIRIATERGLERLEAWTRDDEFVNAWYRRRGFKQIEMYYHIFPDLKEIRQTDILQTDVENCYAVGAYCHYLGDDQVFLDKFKRVHECRRYDLHFSEGSKH